LPSGFGSSTAFKIQSHPSPGIWQPIQFAALRLLCFFAVALFLTGLPILAQASSAVDTSTSCAAELGDGVVVESVAKNSEGERAGLAEGDIILSWSRGDAKGHISSPFDLADAETEQEPRGRVTLEGSRGEARQSWVVGPDTWGIQARPTLPPALLAIYREGQELAKAEKFGEAAERWRAAAAEGTKFRCVWLSPWVLFHAAENLVEPQPSIENT
jgi:hypothetical protein